ncbi:hypothetical protein [Fusobacterium sp. MFO224]|uniref:hypothetical protein n=1 Tax=Fusobacterium sp. MFO224 TaxID=3378070 RepID=UPI003854CAA8
MLKNKNKKKVYIIFSKSNLKIYNGQKRIIDKVYSSKLEYKKIYKKINKKINNKEIIVCFDKGTYIKKEIFENEIFKIENYIQDFCIEELKKDDESFFIKTYKSNNKYNIYIFEREFIEKIIESFIENKILVKGIYIDINLENMINDYDLILRQIKKINYKLILISIFFIIIFLGVKTYENRLKNIIKNLKQQNIILKQENYEIKNQINKNTNNKKDINKSINEKQIKNNIKRNFFLVLSHLNRNITITKYNIGNFDIKLEGNVIYKEVLFNFIKEVESEKKVKYLKYDFIENRDNRYIFSLEIEVF